MKSHRRSRAWVWMGALLCAVGSAGCHGFHAHYEGGHHWRGGGYGDGDGGLFLLGVLGIAWGIHAIAEVCRNH